MVSVLNVMSGKGQGRRGETQSIGTSAEEFGLRKV